MDGLSAAASIIAVLQAAVAAAEVLKAGIEAPKERIKFAIEVDCLHAELKNLSGFCKAYGHSAPDSEILRLAQKDGLIDQYGASLAGWAEKAQPARGFNKVGQFLGATLERKAFSDVLQRVERLRSAIPIALGIDSFKILSDVKDNVDGVVIGLDAVQSQQRIDGQLLSDMNTTTQAINKNAILDWICPPDQFDPHSTFIKDYTRGTGETFLQSPIFLSWCKGLDRTLFCPGSPGAGKSMLSARMIQYLQSLSQQPSAPVLRMYCNHKRQNEQTEEYIISSMLRQLVASQTTVPQVVLRLQSDHLEQRTPPHFEQYLTALVKVAQSMDRIYIVIDALDECKDTVRNKMFKAITSLQCVDSACILVTSRPEPEIKDFFLQTTTLKIKTEDKDVGAYVRSRMGELARCVQKDTSLQQQIVDKIVDAADGMFLLAQLHMTSLKKKLKRTEITTILDSLRKGSGAYDSAYDTAMERVDLEYARDVFRWLVFAKRPMKVAELRHAISIDDGIDHLDDGDILDIDDILSTCAGLVTVDDDTSVIRLVHYTTQEYLVRKRDIYFPRANAYLAKHCMTYMALRGLKHGLCHDYDEYSERMEHYPLYSYCLYFWAGHAQDAEASELAHEDSILDDLSGTFLLERTAFEFVLQAKTLIENRIFCDRDALEKSTDHNPNKHSPPLTLVQSGLSGLLRAWINCSNASETFQADLNTTDYTGLTALAIAAADGDEIITRILLDEEQVKVQAEALTLAAANCHPAVIRFLLDSGRIDVDAQDHHGQTALSRAAENGHEDLVTHLIVKRNAAIALPDYHGRAPISHAAETGQRGVVKILLSAGSVGENLPDDIGRTPLSYAAQNGRSTIVKALMHKVEANFDVQDNKVRTPLYYSVKFEHASVAKLLLDSGQCHVNARDEIQETILLLAVGRRRTTKELVKLLLNHGADTSILDIKGNSALLLAASVGNYGVFDLLCHSSENMNVLLEKEQDNRPPLMTAAYGNSPEIISAIYNSGFIDLEAKDNESRTALAYAAEIDRGPAIKRLLELGADIEAKCEDNQTPLMYALRFNSYSAARIFLEHGANTRARCKNGRTPLSHAMSRRSKTQSVTVELLLMARADIDARDNEGRTPLSHAAQWNAACAEHLINSDAEVDTRDDSGRTPLIYAAISGAFRSWTTIELLLANGAKIDNEDKFGRTALMYCLGGLESSNGRMPSNIPGPQVSENGGDTHDTQKAMRKGSQSSMANAVDWGNESEQMADYYRKSIEVLESHSANKI